MNKSGSRESLLKATVRSDFRSLFLKMTDLGVQDLGLGVLCLSIRFLNVQKKRRFFRERDLFEEEAYARYAAMAKPSRFDAKLFDVSLL